jgi:hypothetical protein
VQTADIPYWNRIVVSSLLATDCSSKLAAKQLRNRASLIDKL